MSDGNLKFEAEIEVGKLTQNIKQIEDEIKRISEKYENIPPMKPPVNPAVLGSFDQLSAKATELKAKMNAINPDSAEWKTYNKELGETQQKLDGIGGASEKTGSTLSQLKNLVGFAAIAAGAQQLVGAIIEVRAEFEKYEAVLTNSLGSEVLAKSAMAELTDFASKTPFALSSLTDAYVRLTNYGLQPNMEEMKAYGDIASSVGKDIGQFSEAVADATTGEFERLKEFGIKASKEGDKVSLTFKGQTTQIQNSSDAIKNYLVSLGQMEGVGGSMDAISKTLGGSISNLGDNWDKLMNTLGGESSGAFAVAIKGLSSLVEMINTAVKSSETLRKEAVQGAITGSSEVTKQEIEVISKSLVGNGMGEKEAQKRAVELYKKQLEEQITQAQGEYDKAIEAGKEKMFRFGSKYKKTQDNIDNSKSNLETLQGQLEVLPTLFADPKTPEKPNPKDEKIIKGTLKLLEAELKKLKDKEGSFLNPDQEAANAEKIIAKTKEIDKYLLEVKQKQKDTSIVDKLKGDYDVKVNLQSDQDIEKALMAKMGIKSLSNMSEIQKQAYEAELKSVKELKEEDKMRLVPMKANTAERLKQLGITQEEAETEADKQARSEENWENTKMAVNDLGKGLGDASEITGAMADLAGTFNENLGDSLATMSDIAGQAANFAANIASENWVGVVTSGLSLITSIINAEQEALEKQIQKSLELNDILRDRNKILLDAGLISAIEANEKETELAISKRKTIADQLGSQEITINFKKVSVDDMMKSIYGDDYTYEQLEAALLKQSKFVQDYKKSIGDDSTTTAWWIKNDIEVQKLTNDIAAANAEVERLKTIAAEDAAFGFNRNDVASSLADGIINGLKLGEEGLGEFTETFNGFLTEMFRTRLIDSILNAKWLTQYIDSIYAAIDADGPDGVNVTKEELAFSNGILIGGIKESGDAWDAINAGLEAYGISISKAAEAPLTNTLKGDIKGITEQTAGALEGKMNSIQLNVIDMRGLMVNQLESLRTIAGNTSYNWHLQSMAEEMTGMRKTLKDISANTAKTTPETQSY